MSAASEAIDRLTRWVDNFPIEGVRFADLSPVFADGEGFRALIDELSEDFEEFDLVAGIDARGFLLAAGVAADYGSGVLAVRKAGKLPPPVLRREYALEYGTAALEIPASGLDLTGKRVLVVDDVLATGGTLCASVDLLRGAGAEVVGVSVVLELGFLDGRAKLPGLTLKVIRTI